MYAKDDSLMKIMQHIGTSLGLAPHKSFGQTIYMPADAEVCFIPSPFYRTHLPCALPTDQELLLFLPLLFLLSLPTQFAHGFVQGHVGQDNRRYLVDLSRTFPPTKGDTKVFDHLWKLFRPEFLKLYTKPLCSDTFSKFMENIDEHNTCKENISKAQEYLENTLIPNTAKKLDELIFTFWKIGKLNFGNNLNIGWLLHQHGVNLRYLTQVYKYAKKIQTKWYHVTPTPNPSASLQIAGVCCHVPPRSPPAHLLHSQSIFISFPLKKILSSAPGGRLETTVGKSDRRSNLCFLFT